MEKRGSSVEGVIGEPSDEDGVDDEMTPGEGVGRYVFGDCVM
jgi:hypothetical protein